MSRRFTLPVLAYASSHGHSRIALLANYSGVLALILSEIFVTSVWYVLANRPPFAKWIQLIIDPGIDILVPSATILFIVSIGTAIVAFKKERKVIPAVISVAGVCLSVASWAALNYWYNRHY